MSPIEQILFGTSVVVALGLMSTPVSAQGPETEGAAATVTIVEPIAIVNYSALALGSVVTDGGTGTVEMAVTGTRVLSASLTAFGSDGHAESTADFKVVGQHDATYAITLPASITLFGPGTMTVDTFTSLPALAGQLDVVMGEQWVRVGATLNVGALQEAGDYVGTFDVTVAYN